jgi:hypothetical protein
MINHIDVLRFQLLNYLFQTGDPNSCSEQTQRWMALNPFSTFPYTHLLHYIFIHSPVPQSVIFSRRLGSLMSSQVSGYPLFSPTVLHSQLLNKCNEFRSANILPDKYHDQPSIYTLPVTSILQSNPRPHGGRSRKRP